MTGMGDAPAARPVHADVVPDRGHGARTWGVQWLAFIAGGVAVAVSRIVFDSRWWIAFVAATAVAVVIDLFRRRAVDRRARMRP